MRVPDVQETFRTAGLEINFATRLVKCREQVRKLTPIEFALLKTLVLKADRVLTHQMLLTQVWGPEYENEREYLRVHISHLRRKIELDPIHPEYIETVPRVGYRFSNDRAP